MNDLNSENLRTYNSQSETFPFMQSLKGWIPDYPVKKILLVCLLIMAHESAVHAQEPVTGWPKDEAEYFRFELGIGFSSEAAFRSVSGELPANSQELDERKAWEAPIFGYGSSLAFNLFLNKRVGIVSGVGISRRGYRTQFRELKDNSLEHEFFSRQVFKNEFLNIPLGLVLRTAEKRVRLIFSFGASVNIKINATKSFDWYREGYDMQSAKETNLSGPALVNPSVFVSMGADIQLAKRLTLRVEPRFSSLVVPYVEDHIRTFLWNAGLNLSFYFGFMERQHLSYRQRQQLKAIKSEKSAGKN